MLRMFVRLAVCLCLPLVEGSAEADVQSEKIGAFFKAIPEDTGIAFFAEHSRPGVLTREGREAMLTGLYGLSDAGADDARVLAVYEAFWNARDSVAWQANLVVPLGNAYYRHGDLAALLARWKERAEKGSHRDALYLNIAYRALMDTSSALSWARVAVTCPLTDHDFWSAAHHRLLLYRLYDEAFFERVLAVPDMPAWQRYSLLSCLPYDRRGETAMALAALHPEAIGDFAPELSEYLKALPWRETVDALHRFIDGQSDPARAAKPRLLVTHLYREHKLAARATDLAWETFTSLEGHADTPVASQGIPTLCLSASPAPWSAETAYFQALDRDLERGHPFETGLLRDDTTARCLRLEALRLCSLLSGKPWTKAWLEQWLAAHPCSPEERVLYSLATGEWDTLPPRLAESESTHPGYLRTVLAALPVLSRDYRLSFAFRRDLFAAVEKIGDRVIAEHPESAAEWVPLFHEVLGKGLQLPEPVLATCQRWLPGWQPGDPPSLAEFQRLYPHLFTPPPPSGVLLDMGDPRLVLRQPTQRVPTLHHGQVAPEPAPWASRFQLYPWFMDFTQLAALREIGRRNTDLPPAVRIRLLSLQTQPSASFHLPPGKTPPSPEPVPLEELEALLAQVDDEDTRLLLAQHLALAEQPDWQRVLDLALPSAGHPGSYGAVANSLVSLAAENTARAEMAAVARAKLGALNHPIEHPAPTVPPLKIEAAPTDRAHPRERPLFASALDFLKGLPDPLEVRRQEAQKLRATALEQAENRATKEALRTWLDAEALSPRDWRDDEFLRALGKALDPDAALEVLIAGLRSEFDGAPSPGVRTIVPSDQSRTLCSSDSLLAEALRRMKSSDRLEPFLSQLKRLTAEGFRTFPLSRTTVLAAAIAGDAALPDLMAGARKSRTLGTDGGFEAFRFLPSRESALRAAVVARLAVDAESAGFTANLENARIANAARDPAAAARFLDLAWASATDDEKRRRFDSLLRESLAARHTVLADSLVTARLDAINAAPQTGFLAEETLRSLADYLRLLHRSERPHFARHIMDRVLALPVSRPITGSAGLVEAALAIDYLEAAEKLWPANPELARFRGPDVYQRHLDLRRRQAVAGELLVWRRPDGRLAWDASASNLHEKDTTTWLGDLAGISVAGSAEILAGPHADALASVATLENYPARGATETPVPANARFLRVIRRSGGSVTIGEPRAILPGENQLRFNRPFDPGPGPVFTETLSLDLFDEPLAADAIPFDPKDDYLLEGWIRLNGNWLNHRFRIGLEPLDEKGETYPDHDPESLVSHRDALWHFVSLRLHGSQLTGDARTLRPVFSFTEKAGVGPSNDRSVTLADFSLVSAPGHAFSSATPPIAGRLPRHFLLAPGTPPRFAFSSEGEIRDLETPEAAPVKAPLRLRAILPFPENRKLLVGDEGTLLRWTPGTADFVPIKGTLMHREGTLVVSPDRRWLTEFARLGTSASMVRLHALEDDGIVLRHSFSLPPDGTISEAGFVTDNLWPHTRLVLRGPATTIVIDPETNREETWETRLPWPADSVTHVLQGTPNPRWHRGDGRSVTTRPGDRIFYTLSPIGNARDFRTPAPITSAAADLARNQWLTLESNGILRAWPLDTLFPHQPITNNE